MPVRGMGCRRWADFIPENISGERLIKKGFLDVFGRFSRREEPVRQNTLPATVLSDDGSIAR
ncbi:hypothetical protein [Thauera sp. SDU_THAU2]|uniref:hypothetical protein n=1 Tax=Thauera sp. SDU_THAU2 TaxID=3136633 RepID=UPI00311E59FC